MDRGRRKFIGVAGALIAAGATGMIGGFGCKTEGPIPGSIVGANSKVGHMLRNYKFPEPTEIIEEEVVIVGGGVSGLSAARWLSKNKFNEYLLLELSESEGGNAVSGKNQVSEFPWGAHYIPIPDIRFIEYKEFLVESNVIVGMNENGLPFFNEEFLCHDPQERLYINGFWQDGLIPSFGLSDDDNRQLKEFLKLMDEFRNAKGADGKDAFAIPVSESSCDVIFTNTDKISMREFLQEKQLTSKYLHWYVDYCCKDDFGTPYEQTSAWAGIHYFAGRKGMGVNADHQDVLTWPEGNSFLVKQLLKDINVENRKVNCIVHNVSISGNKIHVDYFDVKESHSKRIVAEQVILCTPQFINDRLLKSEVNDTTKSSFTYSPWMVANLTVNDFYDDNGMPLSWDNVIYGSESLGYVNACNQSPDLFRKKNVLTYYLPLCNDVPSKEREKAFAMQHNDWVELIVSDLRKTNSDIRRNIENIDVWLWGHAMIQPRVNFMFHSSREARINSEYKNIHFAHSDLSGLSIFEEAFYHGVRTAKDVLAKINAT